MWYFSEQIINKKNFFCVSYLVGAVGLQSIWSLSLALTDVYALMVRRSFRNSGIVSLFAIGDGVRNCPKSSLVKCLFFVNGFFGSYVFGLDHFNLSMSRLSSCSCKSHTCALNFNFRC